MNTKRFNFKLSPWLKGLLGSILVLLFFLTVLFISRDQRRPQNLSQPESVNTQESDLTTLTERVDNLYNATWILDSYGDRHNQQAILEGSKLTVEFDRTNSRVSGLAGCNTYFASFEATDNKLSISSPASTRMRCPEPEGVMELERRYLTALNSAESYHIQDSQLQIFYSGGRVLTFSRKK